MVRACSICCRTPRGRGTVAGGWHKIRRGECADTPDEIGLVAPRRVPQPAKTFEQKLKLHNGPLLCRATTSAATLTPGDRFRRFYDRAEVEGWGAYEIA